LTGVVQFIGIFGIHIRFFRLDPVLQMDGRQAVFLTAWEAGYA
jgi:hypothetical protein